MLEFLRQPWPWYVAGPLIGLTVPYLLLVGNKSFGISANLRHLCAAFVPGGVKFFQYDWKKEAWNLWFAGGIVAGAFLAAKYLSSPEAIAIADSTREHFARQGIRDTRSLLPAELFAWSQLLTPRGLVLMVGGGFLVGFGTRWAGGCTSGHAIMGLSALQAPSLVATCCFMAGGFAMTWLGLPWILSL
jgi:uncharacterized membrane protein YedE/YeeE